MNNFISAYPGVIYLIGLGLTLYIIHQHQKSKKLEESALLNEVSRVATSIENMATDVGRLFRRDEIKTDDIGRLKDRLGKQETKCLEREKICPALIGMRHMREGGALPVADKRETSGDSQPC